MPEDSQNVTDHRRRIGNVVWWVWVSCALLLGTIASIAVCAFLFLEDICMSGLTYIPDRRTPADDSAQGRVCGFSDHASTLVDYSSFSIIAAGFAGLVAAALLWRTARPRLRILAIAVYVLAAPLTTLVLALPSDDCTAEEKARPGAACGRHLQNE